MPELVHSLTSRLSLSRSSLKLLQHQLRLLSGDNTLLLAALTFDFQTPSICFPFFLSRFCLWTPATAGIRLIFQMPQNSNYFAANLKQILVAAEYLGTASLFHSFTAVHQLVAFYKAAGLLQTCKEHCKEQRHLRCTLILPFQHLIFQNSFMRETVIFCVIIEVKLQ